MSMLSDPSAKYRPFPQVDLPNRQWPTRTITAPPRWLSTDLRDGNQSIIDPMDRAKKTRFFDLLVEVGVTEIEVGFPGRRSSNSSAGWYNLARCRKTWWFKCSPSRAKT